MDVLRSNVDVAQGQPANQGLETNLGETERIPEAPSLTLEIKCTRAKRNALTSSPLAFPSQANSLLVMYPRKNSSSASPM